MVIERNKIVSYLINNPYTPVFLVDINNDVIFKFLYKKGENFEFTDYRLDRETDLPHKVPLDTLNNSTFWNQGDVIMTFDEIKMLMDNTNTTS